MRKIILSIIVIGCLLTTSIASVNAWELHGYEVLDNFVPPIYNLNDEVEYWGVFICYNESCFVENAERVREALISQGWLEDHIKTLYYENATKTNFINAISWIAENEDAWDTTLICIHSHGFNGGFCLVDGGMKYKEVDVELDKLKSAAIGIIVDTCHSGTAIPYLQQDGRVIITACNASQVAGSICEFIAYGLDEFADYCISGGNNDGVASMEEVFDYLTHNRIPLEDMTPQLQDNYTGQLHLSFLDWGNGILDQITNYTFRGCYNFNVQIVNRSQGFYESEAAQSFQPSASMLTKVKLHILNEYNISSPMVVSVRKNLTDVDLTSKTLLSDEIKSHRYTTFDFPDINVTPGDTYYIVCRATEEETNPNNRYEIYGLNEDCYKNGMCYTRNTIHPDWTGIEDADMYFAIYGKNGENLPPYVPRRPIGNVFGEKNIFYTYYVSTEDVDDDDVYYKFDWGDNTSSEWLGPYKSGKKAFATHSWSENGSYNLRVKAKEEQGAENSWSSILRVRVGNDRPNAPNIDGPASGKPGEEYEYTFVATDSDDDVLYYYIGWGDETFEEWIGPYDSSEEVTVSHTWSEKGTYTIKAKAKDIYDAESDWTTLPVTMPVNHPSSQSQSQSNPSPSQQSSWKTFEAVKTTRITTR